MNAASSLTRNATAAAISSVSPNRPRGVAAPELLLEGLGQVAGELGVDEPGRDGVARDRPAGQLARRRLGQADEPGLGRGVVGLAHLAGLPGHRGDVHDPAALGLEHRAGHGLGHVERPEQVRLEHLAPALDRHPHDQVVAGHARVVDQDVDLAERLEDLLDDRVGDLRLRGVALDREGPAPERLDRAAAGGGGRGVALVGEGHVRALGRPAAGRWPARCRANHP